jgi:hypothetical protein
MAQKEFSWERIDELLRLEELTAEELQVITAQEAMIRMQKNADLLARVNNLLLEATNELGKWRVIVEKLKHTKNTLIEQNRALKEILKAERW